MTDTASTIQARAAGQHGAGFGRRILALADELATWSEAPDRLACTYLTSAHRSVAAQLHAWMQAAGLDASIDAVGNVVGRYASAHPGARTLIVGSHYDTVRNAGKYDGRLGILAGLVVLEALVKAGEALPFHVELIAFAEEEGVRFGTAYLGSGAIAGRFDPQWLDRRDETGVTIAEAIRSAGHDPADIAMLARRDLLGYLEVHIEQGPVLLDSGLPLGVVTAIAGAARYRVTIRGVGGHAGTVPMAARHDAFAAAAELALALEQRCRQTPGVVGTIGQIAVTDGAANVIPGQCELSLDIRADHGGKLDAAIGYVLAKIRQIEVSRGVAIDVRDLHRTPVIPCAPRMQRLLAGSIERVGAAVCHLPSGAGHDAAMFHGVTEIGMLFVRCGNGGVSHSPLEIVAEEDAGLAAAVLLDALKNLHDAV